MKYFNKYSLWSNSIVFTLKEFVLGLIDNVYSKIGFDTEIKTMNSTVYDSKKMLKYACQYGHKGCVDRAKKEFDKLKSGNYS